MDTIETVETVKLKKTEYGTIRVGDTRVSIDSVVIQYERGATAEEIVESFPDLTLSDVHGVISYYLANKIAVDNYIAESEAAGERISRQLEERRGENIGEFREVIHARYAEMKRETNGLS